MYQTHQTQSIVLNQYSVGDFDSIYVVLSRDFGKIPLFAKSARKPQAKLAPHLEPGSVTEITFVPRLQQDNYLLTGAQIQWKPAFLKLPLIKNQLILQALRLAQRLGPDETLADDQISYIFGITKKYLTIIDSRTCSNNRLALFQGSFLLKILTAAGFSPNLEQCLICGQKVSNKAKIYYDKVNGGLVCCDANPVMFEIKSRHTLKLCRFLLKAPFTRTARLKVATPIIRESSALIDYHLKYCLN